MINNSPITQKQKNHLSMKPFLALMILTFVIMLMSTVTPRAFGAIAWNLDRIDQRYLPLNSSYIYNETGAEVHVYVLDTGITPHSETAGRLGNGFAVPSSPNAYVDCMGHGTAVSSVAGGGVAGVAKHAIIHSVKVACPGTASDIIAGINWINANHKAPAIVNMSLSLNQYVSNVSGAIQNSIDNYGITYVVSAGNDNQNDCSESPQNVYDAIVVGAFISTDQRWPSSNYGGCVDVFAPGGDILAANYTGWSNFHNLWGTSYAAPHVTGCVARYLQFHANADYNINQNWIINNATSGNLGGIPSGTPNRQLYCPPVADSPSGFHRLQVEHSDKFLGLDTDPTQHSDGADAHQWMDNTGMPQRWNLQRVGEGYYRIINKFSGKCLGVNNNLIYGAIGQVHQWTCNYSNDKQEWRFEPIGPVWEGNYRIRNRSSYQQYNTKCIDIENAGQGDGAKAMLWSCHENQNQQWAITPP